MRADVRQWRAGPTRAAFLAPPSRKNDDTGTHHCQHARSRPCKIDFDCFSPFHDDARLAATLTIDLCRRAMMMAKKHARGLRIERDGREFR